MGAASGCVGLAVQVCVYCSVWVGVWAARACGEDRSGARRVLFCFSTCELAPTFAASHAVNPSAGCALRISNASRRAAVASAHWRASLALDGQICLSENSDGEPLRLGPSRSGEPGDGWPPP
eukprot:scaffold1395_cov87-Isochrysis_galbana.AAC.2